MKRIKSVMLGLTLIIGIGLIYNYIQLNKVQEVSISSNYIKYESAEELEKGAELILIGNTKTEFMKREHITTFMSNGAIADFYTLLDFNIKEVVKKPSDFSLDSSKMIKIIEPAGFITKEKIKSEEHNVNTIIKDETYEPLEKNVDYIVFLKKNDKGQYGIINMYRGKFELNKNINPKFHSNEEELDKSYKKMKEEVLKKYSNNIEKIK